MSQLGDYFHIPTDAEVRQLEQEAHQRELLRRQQYQQTMMQAQNAARNLGVQGMAGGAGHVGIGMANAQTNAYNNPQTEAFLKGVRAKVKDEVRNHIAEQVEKMAEEIGAPTLLHAVVLAIRTMEIPE